MTNVHENEIMGQLLLLSKLHVIEVHWSNMTKMNVQRFLKSVLPKPIFITFRQKIALN